MFLHLPLWFEVQFRSETLQVELGLLVKNGNVLV